MSEKAFVIRAATADDCEIIAHHRAAMFRDMGAVPAEFFQKLHEESAQRLRKMFEEEKYTGWLASPVGDRKKIIAGVGVHRRKVLPFPLKRGDGSVSITEGRQALVVNVYTEPEYRRRGVARLLMEELMEWAAGAGIDALILHAAPDGRHLYEKLGFKQTNEMRFPGDIADWKRDLRANAEGGR